MARPRRKPDPGTACAAIDALLDAVADYHRISLPLRPDYDKLAAKHARAAALAAALGHPLPPLDEAGLPVWRERLADPCGGYHTCWEQEAIASPQRHDHWREKVRATRLAVEALKGAPPGKERLTVDLDHLTLTLDGTIHQVGNEESLRWVKVLADHPGQWISGNTLGGYDRELTDARTDRLKGHLPDPVLRLIDSSPSKGSRIRLA